MDNQHRKISGYRELSQTEIDLMNEIKEFGPKLADLYGRIYDHVERQYDLAYAPDNYDELTRLDKSETNLWLCEGKKHLQMGLMFLTRSVAQPTFF